MIYSETPPNLWTRDLNSGEYLKLNSTQRVDSAIAISDYSTLNNTFKNFEIIEWNFCD